MSVSRRRRRKRRKPPPPVLQARVCRHEYHGSEILDYCPRCGGPPPVWGERCNETDRPTLTVPEIELIRRCFRDPQLFQRIPPHKYGYYLELIRHAACYGHRPSIRTAAGYALQVIIERHRLLAEDPVNGGTLRVDS